MSGTRRSQVDRAVCFSAQADLLGGTVIAIVGFDALRHVGQRRDQIAVVALPLLLAAHQLDEAFVWWGLQGHVAVSIGRTAMWLYLLFAFVFLPVYVPLAVRAIEPPGPRRRTMTAFAGLGAGVSGLLLLAMARGPVTARLAHDHLAYDIHMHAGLAIVAAYVAATCGSLIFSSHRRIAIFGIINLIAVAALAHLAIDGFASMWCAWAALTSVAIAMHRRTRPAHTEELSEPA